MDIGCIVPLVRQCHIAGHPSGKCQLKPVADMAEIDESDQTAFADADNFLQNSFGIDQFLQHSGQQHAVKTRILQIVKITIQIAVDHRNTAFDTFSNHIRIDFHTERTDIFALFDIFSAIHNVKKMNPCNTEFIFLLILVIYKHIYPSPMNKI